MNRLLQYQSTIEENFCPVRVRFRGGLGCPCFARNCRVGPILPTESVQEAEMGNTGDCAASLEMANLERSVAAKQMERASLVKAEPGWVMADRWGREEIIRFYDLLRAKKRSEIKFMKKSRETNIRREGSMMDRDGEEFFAFRSRWMTEWSGSCGLVDNVTKILSMPFTYHGPPQCAYPCDTLQIYSVRVEDLLGGLEWPLDVFDMVAVRDSIDRKLNLVFCRTRENCQTLTDKDPYLALTGPTRAVVLDPKTDLIVEVELKVRGQTESEDRYLSFVAAPVECNKDLSPNISHYMSYMSKLSLLMFKLGRIESSVEATVFVRSIEGSWPDGVNGQITAQGAECEKVVLLEFGSDKVPVSGGGDVELARQVVSVEYGNQLDVSCNAWKDDRIIAKRHAVFKAAAVGRNNATLELGTCKLDVVVAWSLVSPERDGTMMWC